MGTISEQGHSECLPLQRVYQRRHEIVESLRLWGTEHFRTFPWRDPGRTLYEVLVAEVLLKRTTATAASRAYSDFLARFPDLDRMANATLAELEHALAPVGLQLQRAKATRALAGYLLSKHGGTIPETLQELLAVPGLGPYSARALLAFGLGLAVAVCDTNVRRILKRVFADAGATHLADGQLQTLADALLPDWGHLPHNYALLDLGSTVCRYDRPRCEVCPIKGLCDSGRTR